MICDFHIGLVKEESHEVAGALLQRPTMLSLGSMYLLMECVRVRIGILPSVIDIISSFLILGVSIINFYIIPLGHAKTSFTDGSFLQ